ncbi:16S rRNA (guanine(527)-N(7))-methyltransferase RsmG [Sphingorhabdus lutea]|uniref:Ribosomal RNA small subunit methyltransferase G n=1 Tax=Sphingorhabdus lutea TaxID=1913578 RepID=A0A1L3J9G6_9SPHN|nr:16S rRNA (guanine(527)-N(7))-methyltransferase RsmG [Sphingorhabdus lutea]APG61760.1 16S rRNA (guanine(527)-N(7))-methyltransferase RsmG [Sphingorhabdus lutea]
MDEHQARQWLETECRVSRETMEMLEQFCAFLYEEMQGQNLIAPASFEHIWTRHIVDSAQLIKLLPADSHQWQNRKWLDMGSGAGFPGLIIAMLTSWRVTLVESRRKRIEYLLRAVEKFGLQQRVTIAGERLENVPTAPFSVISARAFAPLPKLLDISERFSTNKTCWLLPKGQNAARELEESSLYWDLDFEIRPSITDADAGILVGRVHGQNRKMRGKR